MEVRLLGPVVVIVDGVPKPVPGKRRKAVLAALALQAGQVVSAGRLIDLVWDGEAPATAVNTLQSHVSYLRRLLGTRSAILAHGEGYVLELAGDATDVRLAERLIAEGDGMSDPQEVKTRLGAVLELWRGRPLEDLAGTPWFDQQARRLDQLRLQATKAWVQARLSLGEHAQLLTALEQLAHDHPHDERVHAQLILALYRSGRQADALAVYRRLCRTLRDDLGIEPGRELRDLEGAVLRQDVALELVPAEGEPVPAQLPPVTPGFVGRDAELARLDEALGGLTEGAVVISAVSGAAGVGKTTLAVHWAHRVADRFPDGRLYVNLRGFGPNGSLTSPAEAVRGFLDALGVPAHRIPAGLDAQVALYRSRMSGRRMLLLLDNARDAGQVRHLLPGAPGSLVLVTSRNQLSGLVATEGARLLVVDVLSHRDSRRMLERRLGAERVATESTAVDEIIDRCVRLPLALAIVAARAASHPQFRLEELASALEGSQRLDALTAGDAVADVRGALSWSFHALSAGAASMFRMLGLHPGPDVSAEAAASLADVPLRQACRSLAELAQAQLVVEHRPGRYVFHDLLRAYATELADREESAEQRDAAVLRMLDHYLRTAHAGALLLNPSRDPITLPPSRVSGEQLRDHQQALAWFTAEHRVLLAVLELASERDTYVCQLAWTLSTFLNRQGHWRDWAATAEAALTAARRLMDPAAQAVAHRDLGWACTQLGDHVRAAAELQCALDFLCGTGDEVGQADTHLDLGRIFATTARYSNALHHAKEAFGLYLAAGQRAGQAAAVNNIGWCQAQLGDYDQGLASCQLALALQLDLGNRDGQAGAWDSLGLVYRGLGQHTRSAACYTHALALYRDLGDRFEEAATSRNLGDTHLAAGCPDLAREVWLHALAVFDELDHPDADEVRAKLEQHPSPLR